MPQDRVYLLVETIRWFRVWSKMDSPPPVSLAGTDFCEPGHFFWQSAIFSVPEAVSKMIRKVADPMIRSSSRVGFGLILFAYMIC